MARPLRIQFQGAVYHITARGNARRDIFRDDADRRAFIGLLAREVGQQQWRLYAYCLMNNHYHLLIETPEGNLIDGMRRLNSVYSQKFNRRHGEVGHVLQGRYKSIVVDRDSYLLELCRYVVLNPVRAGQVDRASNWRWSSYRATEGTENSESWLDVDAVLGCFSPRRSAAIAAYRRFVAEGIRRPSPWKDLRGQIWLGREPFLNRMSELVVKKAERDIPQPQTRPTRPKAAEVIDAVCEAYGLREEDLDRRRVPEAYRGAVFLLRRVANVKLGLVADRFHVSPSRISKIQRAIQDGNVEPKLKRLLRKYKVKI